MQDCQLGSVIFAIFPPGSELHSSWFLNEVHSIKLTSFDFHSRRAIPPPVPEFHLRLFSPLFFPNAVKVNSVRIIKVIKMYQEVGELLNLSGVRRMEGTLNFRRNFFGNTASSAKSTGTATARISHRRLRECLSVCPLSTS